MTEQTRKLTGTGIKSVRLGYRTHDGCYRARAQARVIVHRRLREEEVTVASQWDDLKGGN